MNNIRFITITFFIFLIAFSRVLPHPPNFSSITAMGLFGAACFTNRWLSFFVVFFSIWISDLFINNIIYAEYYNEFIWFYPGFYWQYFAHLITLLIGMCFLNNIKIKNIFFSTVLSTLSFYIISNFGCWLGSTFYPQNLTGLLSCYIAATPFLGNSILGDISYTVILFGGYYILGKKYPTLLSTK